MQNRNLLFFLPNASKFVIVIGILVIISKLKILKSNFKINNLNSIIK